MIIWPQSRSIYIRTYSMGRTKHECHWCTCYWTGNWVKYLCAPLVHTSLDTTLHSIPHAMLTFYSHAMLTFYSHACIFTFHSHAHMACYFERTYPVNFSTCQLNFSHCLNKTLLMAVYLLLDLSHYVQTQSVSYWASYVGIFTFLCRYIHIPFPEVEISSWLLANCWPFKTHFHVLLTLCSHSYSCWQLVWTSSPGIIVLKTIFPPPLYIIIMFVFHDADCRLIF